MQMQQVEQVLKSVTGWAAERPGVIGAALVGSWANGRDHAEADLDIVCLVDSPEQYFADSGWLSAIDWGAAGLTLDGWAEADYGRARSRHLRFDSGDEVEMTFADAGWAHLDPIDIGTRRVASDGMRILYDPRGVLGRLLAAL